MSRVVEVTKEIDAPVDEVWRALTEARSLEQWFAVEARVTPGPNRKLWLSWGEGSQGEGQIFHWEPNKRFSWGDDVGGVRMATDYFLEARGAKTVVRVVTSGFSDDPAWDDDFHMMEGGWAYFMSHLKTWLERHRGQARALASSREQSELPKPEAFARLVRALGFAETPTGAGRYAVNGRQEGSREAGTVAVDVRLGRGRLGRTCITHATAL